MTPGFFACVIRRAAARPVRKCDRVYVVIGYMKLSIEISVSGTPCIPLSATTDAGTPIALNEISIPPALVTTPSRCFSIEASSRASTSSDSAAPPSDTIFRATASTFAAVQPVRKTRAPSFAKAAATALPYRSSSPINHCDFVLEQHEKSSRRVVHPLLSRVEDSGYFLPANTDVMRYRIRLLPHRSRRLFVS